MAQNFTIGPFEFRLHENQVNAPDYKVNDITYEKTSVLFQIVFIDTTTECGPRSCFNFVEFIWNYLGLFRFKMYAIVAVPFGDEPTILYLQHLRAASDGWPTDFLYVYCLEEFQQVLAPIVGNCNLERCCRWNVCLSQTPTLRNSASYTVFHVTFNVNQFTLNGMTLYEQFKHAVRSSLVPNHRLVPHTFPVLKCNFVRSRHCGIKRFHYRCVNPAERVVKMWSTFHVKFCDNANDAIMTLLNNRKYWWCNFCDRPLFIPPESVR